MVLNLWIVNQSLGVQSKLFTYCYDIIIIIIIIIIICYHLYARYLQLHA